MITCFPASLYTRSIAGMLALALLGCASNPPPKTTTVTSYTPPSVSNSPQTYSTAWAAPSQKTPDDRNTVNSSNQQLYNTERTPVSTSYPPPINAPTHPTPPDPGIP